MKNVWRILILLFLLGSLIICMDTILSRILSRSPLLSIREYIEPNGSYVDKGFIINKFYCVGEDGLVITRWIYRTENHSCFKENLIKNNEYIMIQSRNSENRVQFKLTDSKEINTIKDLINNSQFKQETCDGLNEYIMTLEDGEMYGIEVYTDIIHLTHQTKGETILSLEDSKIIKDIINKYK